MRDFWTQLDRIVRSDAEGALVTITDTEGSAYQREGTKLIFLENAEPIGTISGGCLEADLFEHCRKVINKGDPSIVRLPSRSETRPVVPVACARTSPASSWPERSEKHH